MHLSRLGLLVHLVASLPWWHPSTSALPWHGSILGVLMHLAGAARTSAMGVAGIGVHLWCVMGLKGMLPALLDWGAACLLITAVPLALCSRNAISGSTSIGNAPSAPFRGPCGWHGMPDGPHLIAAATFVGLVGLAPFHVAPLLVWAASLWYPHARGSTSSSILPGGPCACIHGGVLVWWMLFTANLWVQIVTSPPWHAHSSPSNS